MKLNKTEIKILYTILNYHLNTIGEVITYLPGKNFESGYVWTLEKLEKKLEKHL